LSGTIINSINSRLPWDISVESVERVDDSWDPRVNIRRKQYSYTIKYRRKLLRSQDDGTRELSPVCRLGPHSFRSAHDGPCVWHVPWAIDDSQVPAICEFLMGAHDFSPFVHKDDRSKQSNQMILQKMTFEILNSTTNSTGAPVATARFVVESVGFRRSMVRKLVGFCVDVCRGAFEEWNWQTELWTEQIAADKINAAPASGLCLEFVEYEKENN
jgi:tRNA pseudouridine(38-40) synthase